MRVAFWFIRRTDARAQVSKLRIGEEPREGENNHKEKEGEKTR